MKPRKEVGQVTGEAALDLPPLARAMTKELSGHIEEMAAAFYKKTDIPPEECEIIYRPILSGGFAISIQRKEK